MSNTAKLLGVGILPLAVGFAFNYLILYLPLPGFLLLPIELALLVLLGCLAFKLSTPEKNPFAQSLMLCAFGLLMLALVLYQELVLGQYWGNLVGFGTQMYFLPLLTLAAQITVPVMRSFMEVIRVWPAYIVVWILMFAASCVGCFLKRRR